jgi:cytochrome oxidase Cu insertion factor (SCO1/SenC/PrrC family)
LNRRGALWTLAALPGCAAADALGARGGDPRARIFDAPWVWSDEDGSPTTFARWRGSTIVTTGFFASCTVRCPMTIAKLREMDEALRAHGRSAQFVLVTIDPDNDTVERLRRLKASRELPASWHLLRGSREATMGFGRWLRLNVARDSGHIDHEVRIAVLDTNGLLVRSFAGWSFGEDEFLSASH